MNTHSPGAWQRRFKWTVYTLLLVDFVVYFYQDLRAADHMLGAHASFLQFARAYLTTIDLIAWFVLILFFELETGVLARRLETGAKRWAIRGVRLFCYVAILHTSFGNVGILRDVRSPQPLPAAANVCDYMNGGWSFLRNREYTYVDDTNCAALGTGPEFFVIDPGLVVTDRAGLDEARILAWTDVIESLSWLLIVFGNEIVIRMQARGFAGGFALAVIGRAKIALYAAILAIAGYWGSKQQCLYFWDELLWVCGFLVIESNLVAQHARMRAVKASPPRAALP